MNWLSDWLINWLIYWLIYYLAGCLTDWHAHSPLQTPARTLAHLLPCSIIPKHHLYTTTGWHPYESRPPLLQNIRLATSNVRIVHNKSASITDLVISKKLDILTLTLTWLSPLDTASCIFYICPRLFLLPPGTVGFLVSNKFKVKSYSVPIYFSF